jgi:hypothetical protein
LKKKLKTARKMEHGCLAKLEMVESLQTHEWNNTEVKFFGEIPEEPLIGFDGTFLTCQLI